MTRRVDSAVLWMYDTLYDEHDDDAEGGDSSMLNDQEKKWIEKELVEAREVLIDCTCGVDPYRSPDPDCELHFPSCIDDKGSRDYALRWWYAGYVACMTMNLTRKR